MPTTSTHNSPAIALDVIRRGYAPVPIPVGEKNPTLPRWQHLRITAEMVPQYFTNANGIEYNVGAIMGAASGNLADMDLDCGEAIALAQYFLPNTGAIYGRPGKRRSHWLYICTDLATAAPVKAAIQLKDENRVMICEFRFGGGGRGAQSVMPGSVHTSGEHYEYDADGAPGQVTFAVLQTANMKIAVAALLVRHWPQLGGRNEAALILGGLLARAGWSEDEIFYFVEIVANNGGSEDPHARAAGAASAHAAHARGDNVYGFPAFAEFFGAALAKKIAKLLGYRATDQRAVFEDSQVMDAVNTINENHAFVLAGDKGVVMKFESATSFRLLKVSAFKLWYANQTIVIGNKAVDIGACWLTHPERRQYEGIEFAPRQTGRTGYYNLWQGFTCTPRTGSCEKFLAHLKENVAGGDINIYNWVVGFFAHIYQRPWEKLDTALALRGKMGAGKTKVGEIFGSLLGAHYVLVADERYVTGKFNAHMASLLMLHADEAFWAGDKRAEGKLKDLVSGKQHLIEFKGVDPVRVQNLIRLFVTGNPDWLVPTGFDERRFAVLDVRATHAQDHPYFAAIDEEMANGGREALLQYLLNFDLSTVNLRSIPRTTALFEQQVLSMDEKEAWWLDTLRRGELPSVVVDGDFSKCSSSVLYNDYVTRSTQAGAKRKSMETALGSFLFKHVPRLKKTRGMYGFPRLKLCRRAFAKLMNSKITWEEPNLDWREVSF
jgi:hypothetical protein